MILSQENNHLEKDVENKGETEMAYRNNSLSTGGSSDYHDVIFECNNSDTFKTLVTFTDDAYALQNQVLEYFRNHVIIYVLKMLD